MIHIYHFESCVYTSERQSLLPERHHHISIRATWACEKKVDFETEGKNLPFL